jgi:hypothetical protein
MGEQSAFSHRDDTAPTAASVARDPDVRALQALAVATLALAFVVIGLRIAAGYNLESVWDDAMMFERYGHRVLAEHRLAWNPAGEPTYGATSLAQVALVTAIRAIVGNVPGKSALLSSAIAGVTFLLLLLYMLTRSIDGSPTSRAASRLLVLVVLASSVAIDHFLSGMDTALSMAFLTTYLIACRRMERRAGHASAVLVGVLGGLAFAVRPELPLFTVGVPLAMLVFGSRSASWAEPGVTGRSLRARAAVALGVTFALLVGLLCLNAAYFKSAVPLSFYAKALDLYGDDIRRAYKHTALNQLIQFISAYWPLVAIIAVDLWLRLRGRLGAATSMEHGVLGASLGLIAFHAFFTLQVMGNAQRFYQPAVVGLVFLTGQALGRLEATFLPPLLAACRLPALRAAVAAIALASWPLGVSAANALLRAKPFGVFAVTDEHRSYWFGIDAIAALPDDLVMASTEVGLPGTLSPNKVVVDLAGLNERDYAVRPFSAADLFARYAPDVIYLPHPDYASMTAELTGSDGYREYEAFGPEQLGTTAFGLAIRRSSRHHDALRKIVGDLRSRAPETRPCTRAR